MGERATNTFVPRQISGVYPMPQLSIALHVFFSYNVNAQLKPIRTDLPQY